ncbi:MAG TPA: hypothetical protein VE439_06720 [Anaerolineae bacterium]|jgi:hypothetical protein|nr:hypothetical protein [Anaerolineae bacterium]
MNKKVAKFVKRLNSKTRVVVLDILGSPTKWNLIQFYKANPFSIHTPRGLANIIGRKADLVHKEAEELTNAGVLKKISENGSFSSIYSYEPEADIACVIDALIEIGNERRNFIDDLCNIIKNG